jgi:uncharacterized protein (TIGR03083 family)
MKVSEYLGNLASAGGRLAGAAALAGPDAAVPTCPGWVVRDLVRHQGGIHRWAAGYVAGPRTERWDADLPEIAGAWPPDDELLDWFAAGHAELLATLSGADPGLVCWTFLRAPTPLTMWARRQAHETTVHGVDAELAAGLVPAAIAPDFAADGTDELLTCFITRPVCGLRATTEQRLRISCTDAAGDWLVTIGPDGPPVTTRPAGGADSVVSGTAADLYLALWNRRSPETLTVEGDPSILALFLDQVHVRWG